jgi:hypothetical protein
VRLRNRRFLPFFRVILAPPGVLPLLPVHILISQADHLLKPQVRSAGSRSQGDAQIRLPIVLVVHLDQHAQVFDGLLRDLPFRARHYYDEFVPADTRHKARFVEGGFQHLSGAADDGIAGQVGHGLGEPAKLHQSLRLKQLHPGPEGIGAGQHKARVDSRTQHLAERAAPLPGCRTPGNLALGLRPLHPALAAALAAAGQSTLSPLETVERGYANLVTNLRSLGAQVEKVD